MNHQTQPRLLPASSYSETWWRQLDNENLLSGDEWMHEPGVLSENSWIVWGSHPMEMPATGGGPLFFPTAADCLFWFRWHVLKTEDDDESTDSDVETLRSQIDSAPQGTDADRLLSKLAPQLISVGAEIDVSGIESIHEHLTELGDVELWHRAFQAPDISFCDGRWSLPQPVWERLRELFEPYEWGGGFALEDLLDEEV
jgi:hypothetical protein